MSEGIELMQMCCEDGWVGIWYGYVGESEFLFGRCGCLDGGCGDRSGWGLCGTEVAMAL